MYYNLIVFVIAAIGMVGTQVQLPNTGKRESQDSQSEYIKRTSTLDDGCYALHQNQPSDATKWSCTPVSQCNEFSSILRFGGTVISCGPLSICCPTPKYPRPQSYYPTSLTSTVIRPLIIVMDTTCDSIRAKYEHFSWSCGPRSCAEGEKSLHNRYLFEKVRCDSDDPSRICCPKFEFDLKPSPTSTNSSTMSSTNSSTTSSTNSSTNPQQPKKEIDVSCARTTKKYKNRFTWSCQKECKSASVEKGQSPEGMNETVPCDHDDEAMKCCPQPLKSPTNTSQPSPTSAAPAKPSKTTPEVQRTSPATPTLPPRRPISRRTTTIAPPTKTKLDLGCKRTCQNYDNKVKWVCEKAPCAELELNQLNNLVKEKTRCDAKDATKICCAQLERKPSSTGQGAATTGQTKGKPTTTEEAMTSTIAASTPAASTPAASTPVGSTPAASTPAGSTLDASTPAGSTPDNTMTPADSSTPFVPLTTLPPFNTLKPVKPSILSSPDAVGDDELLNELKKKRYSVFDRDLLSVLAKESPQANIVVSPLSIKLLLALIMEGAGGQTSNEIIRALQLPLNKVAASTLLQKLQSLVLVPEKSTIIVLESQNKIYKAPDIELQDEYKNTVSDRYKADVEELDFSQPQIASNHINGWVINSTHGFIPSLVEEDNIKDTMKLFLVNYIYLKGNWDIEFNRQATRSGCFHPSYDNPDECRTVAFMYKKRAVKYQDSDDLDAQIVEIPFKDTRYVVNFVLPNEENNAHKLLEKMNRKDLFDLFTNLEQTSINLQLPRTTIDYSSDMAEVLQHPSLRIKELFKPTADLSKMLNTNAQTGISSILHKARIEMNEEGTKAAGASGGGVQVLSLTSEKNVVFDRPYLFFIRDTKVGGFLFEGIVVSPDEAKSQVENFGSY